MPNQSGPRDESQPAGEFDWTAHPRGPTWTEQAPESGSIEDRLARAIEALTDVVERVARALPGREGVGDLSARIEQVRALLREPESGRESLGATPRGAARAETTRGLAGGQPDSEQIEENRPYRGETGGQSHV